MKILRGWSTDAGRDPTHPLNDRRWSFFLEFRGGDVCDPVGIGSNWFHPPYPSRVWRWFCKWPILPFIAWRFRDKGGYAGWKAYGVDAPEYKDWLCPPEEVFVGSQALCFSIRPFATIRP